MLRKIRIIFSLIIIILFFLVFFEIKDLYFISFFLGHTQFVPSLIEFLHNGLTFISSGFLVILILTLLFGRVYCSFLCPLGILQDIFIFFKNRIFKLKNKFIIDYKIIRYFILFIFFILLFVKLNSLVGFLDPYSNFGKITVNILKPILVIILKNFFNLLNKIELHTIPAYLFLYSLLFLLVLIIITFLKNRLFCNTLCPVGAILGLISKIALFKITIDDKNCKKCDKCVTSCKANCINIENKVIDNERCVKCFNCIYNCQNKLINFSILKINQFKNKMDYERRQFLKSVFVLLLFFSRVEKIFANIINYKKKNPLITPPGSKNLEEFNKKCIACHLCVSVCPMKVLTPATFEYGIEGIFHPKMDYDKSYCLYECNICSKVCPTRAINPLSVLEKKITQIGVANYIKENCIVVRNETDCGVCNEYCPTKAVKLVYYKRDLYVPYISKNICIGCGACEYVCPARPFKAIYVEGNKMHKIAEKPEVRKRKNNRKGWENDFPF